MALLEVKNLTYGYSHGTPFEITALDNINISVNKGEFIGIIGHTGSGKSTLMQMLNGLLKPDKGNVYFEGKDIHSDKKYTREVRFKVGLCFQYPEYQLFEETCEKDISFGPSNMGLDKEEIHKRVIFAAETTGFPKDLLDSSPFDISGGQKRRCAIAGVMAMQPEVIIMDEPSAGLDPKGRKDIFDMIKRYQQSTGATVIVVSHNMEDIAEVANRIIVLNKGKIFLDGTVSEVFTHSDELINIGLNIPVCTRLLLKLKENNINVPTNIYTSEKAAEAIFNYIKEVQKN